MIDFSSDFYPLEHGFYLVFYGFCKMLVDFANFFADFAKAVIETIIQNLFIGVSFLFFLV